MPPKSPNFGGLCKLCLPQLLGARGANLYIRSATRFLDAAAEGLKKCYEQNALDEAAAEENQGHEEN